MTGPIPPFDRNIQPCLRSLSSPHRAPRRTLTKPIRQMRPYHRAEKRQTKMHPTPPSIFFFSTDSLQMISFRPKTQIRAAAFFSPAVRMFFVGHSEITQIRLSSAFSD